MIGSLRGTLLERSQLNEVLVECAGVGYRVTVSPATVVELGELVDEVFLYIHHHRREDAETLYGFRSRDERVSFEALLGAHGVGPALALGILSVHAPSALRQVLGEDDLSALCLVPGVGKKPAARLRDELKSRLDIPDLDLSAPAGGSPAGATRVPATTSARADVREALTGLGYQPDEVLAVLRELPDGDDSATLLRDALQRLAVGAPG
jgi:Holliday junction DNA helicase RuvA